MDHGVTRANTEASGQSALVALVQGRVQGVGFRYFVLEHARELALSGTVRNMPDGSVEVRARGERTGLDRLIELLWKGPRLSRVTHVHLQWDVPLEPREGFDVAF